MRSRGNPASLQLADVVERVRAVVGDEWEKTSDTRNALGEPLPTSNQVRYALIELARQKVIERDPPMDVQDVGGRTLRWKLKASPERDLARLSLRCDVSVLSHLASSPPIRVHDVHAQAAKYPILAQPTHI